MGVLIKRVSDRWFHQVLVVPADCKRRHAAARSFIGIDLCVGHLRRAGVLRGGS